MKIMSLNVWGGRRIAKLLLFLATSKDRETDVFCFQEIFSSPCIASRFGKTEGMEFNLFSQIAQTLPQHTGFFAPTSDHMDVIGDQWVGGRYSKERCPVSIGNAIFVRKGLDIEGVGDLFVYGNRNSKALKQSAFSPKSLQYVVIRNEKDRYSLFNFHGLWNGGGKKDCPERLEQSKRIVDFMSRFSGKKILCGDFNLDPETESIADIEYNGKMVNLIKKYDIRSTRTKLYRDYETGSLFADYAFASQDVLVGAFYVDSGESAEVSDHAPLLLICK